jgi:hypothetical protein
MPLGRGGYVPMRALFGKGREATFEDFMKAKIRKIALCGVKTGPPQRFCQKWRKNPGQSALDDAFHRMFELSRTEPSPTLGERLDRLVRLRAAVSDNEARFEAAISADFGHRSSTETAIAESLLVLAKIKQPPNT